MLSWHFNWYKREEGNKGVKKLHMWLLPSSFLWQGYKCPLVVSSCVFLLCPKHHQLLQQLITQMGKFKQENLPDQNDN